MDATLYREALRDLLLYVMDDLFPTLAWSDDDDPGALAFPEEPDTFDEFAYTLAEVRGLWAV